MDSDRLPRWQSHTPTNSGSTAWIQLFVITIQLSACFFFLEEKIKVRGKSFGWTRPEELGEGIPVYEIHCIHV